MNQLFLSCVSGEFRSYRDTLRHNLNLPDCTIQIQEDFPAGGVPTLEKLDLYIRDCDAVIQLVGDGLGSTAKPPLDHLPQRPLPRPEGPLPGTGPLPQSRGAIPFLHAVGGLAGAVPWQAAAPVHAHGGGPQGA